MHTTLIQCPIRTTTLCRYIHWRRGGTAAAVWVCGDAIYRSIGGGPAVGTAASSPTKYEPTPTLDYYGINTLSMTGIARSADRYRRGVGCAALVVGRQGFGQVPVCQLCADDMTGRDLDQRRRVFGFSARCR